MACLDFVRINRILLELRKNELNRIFEPKSLPFDRDASLELLVVLDRVSDLTTRIYTLAFYRVYHVTGSFIAKSHK